jgi:hypothetical protein
MFGRLLAWRRRRPAPSPFARADAPPPAPRGRGMSGPYLLLHTYLDTRFADTVVLTFAQIEDVLGFALPAQARLQTEWWTDGSVNIVAPHHSDSWRLASRTAVPNLSAQIVSFARAF